MVFKLAPDGTNYKVLHAFCKETDCSDGASPSGRLIFDRSGNLFGTTGSGGGPGCGGSGCGTVFKLAPNGTNYKVVYGFCKQAGCTDGDSPGGGLIADRSGNLYGTTSSGGALDDGVVFKLAGTGFVVAP